LKQTKQKRAKAGLPLVVEFQHHRWRHGAWAAGEIAVAVALLVVTDTVGKWLGALLLVHGLVQTRRFISTFLHAAGTITITQDQSSLPRGLCSKESVAIPTETIRHAFLLRRAVPWNQTGPLLIVETTDQAFSYPRDWFATDTDQESVAEAIASR